MSLCSDVLWDLASKYGWALSRVQNNKAVIVIGPNQVSAVGGFWNEENPNMDEIEHWDQVDLQPIVIGPYQGPWFKAVLSCDRLSEGKRHSVSLPSLSCRLQIPLVGFKMRKKRSQMFLQGLPGLIPETDGAGNSFGRARSFAHKLKFVFLIFLFLLVWLSIEEDVKSYNIIQSRRFNVAKLCPKTL